MTHPPTPDTFADLDVDWFEAALSGEEPIGLAEVLVEPLGPSVGLVGDLARVHLDYTAGVGPSTVIVKLPTTEPGGRRVGDMLNSYAREVAFYLDAAPVMPDTSLPRCFYAAGDVASERWVLVLEDCPSDALRLVDGVSLGQAHAVVDSLAALHARWWESADKFAWMPGFDTTGLGGLQEPWLQSLPIFLDRYDALIPKPTGAWVAAFALTLSDWCGKVSTEPLTIVHTDCRTDNLIFNDDSVTIIDWQTALRGPAAMDVTCFLATSLTIEQRRAHEGSLIERYLGRLAERSVEVDQDWFETSYDENLLWWMGQFGNNLAHLHVDDADTQASLDAMVERTYTAALDREVGRLLA